MYGAWEGVSYGTDPFPIAMKNSSFGISPIDGYISRLVFGRISREEHSIHCRVRCARRVGLSTIVPVWEYRYLA